MIFVELVNKVVEWPRNEQTILFSLHNPTLMFMQGHLLKVTHTFHKSIIVQKNSIVQTDFYVTFHKAEILNRPLWRVTGFSSFQLAWKGSNWSLVIVNRTDVMLGKIRTFLTQMNAGGYVLPLTDADLMSIQKRN